MDPTNLVKRSTRHTSGNLLDQFPTETFSRVRLELIPTLDRMATRKKMLGAVLVCVAISLATLIWLRPTATGAETLTGLLRVESERADTAVFVDGKLSGTAPVSLVLHPGKHQLVVRQGDRSQEIPVTIERNMSTVHHIAWLADMTPRSARGTLRVTSDNLTGRVTIDGVDRGPTPLTVTNLAPGDHQVVVRGGDQVHRRSIRIEPGATASWVISLSTLDKRVQPAWLAVTAGTPLQVLEGGKLVGSTESETIMLPAGDHTFEFMNAALGFRTTRIVKIGAGQTTSVTIELPHTTMSVNATPWAQVWLDGESIGDTPIGNLSTVIGSHELIFRHPQLGERRVTALVTVNEPARVAVDMRKSQ
jgi:serine/threonine-protein kinase